MNKASFLYWNYLSRYDSPNARVVHSLLDNLSFHGGLSAAFRDMSPEEQERLVCEWINIVAIEGFLPKGLTWIRTPRKEVGGNDV